MNAIVKIEMPDSADLAGEVMHLVRITQTVLRQMQSIRKDAGGMVQITVDPSDFSDLDFLLNQIADRASQIEEGAIPVRAPVGVISADASSVYS